MKKHTKAGGAILFSSHIDPKLKITKKITLHKINNIKITNEFFNKWGKLWNDLGILVRREFKILLVSVKHVLAYSSFFTCFFIICIFSWT